MIPTGNVQRLIVVAVCLLLLPAGASAQAFGSVDGTVRDPKGDVVSQATVTLVNTSTNATRSITTSDDGAFQLSQVPPGEYQVRVEAPGFKTIVQDVVVQVSTPLTLAFLFEVGDVTDTVEVVAGEEVINQRDASIGETFNETQIRQLPIEARNVVTLLSLQPGVIKTDGGSSDHRSGAVNGARSDQTNVMLDGVDVNDQVYGYAFTSVVPVTLDSVQEFRVITTNANADMGRSAGAQVSLVTKTGSNEFHGSAYEFHRNTVTTANDFFNNAAGHYGPRPATTAPTIPRSSSARRTWVTSASLGRS
jgi:hypothetical protein